MDIYQTITDTIIKAIEANPSKAVMPWHRGVATPTNASTKKTYNGINILTLWACGMQYRNSLWATYNQWHEMGCQVRKGEKGSTIIFYALFDAKKDDEEDDKRKIPFIRQSSVFNADQVDGYEAPVVPKLPPLERLQAIDAFVAKTGAKVIEGGATAYYQPSTDTIHMPDGERFFDTKSTRTENYYSVLCHELVHYTGVKKRLDRDMTGRFGNQSYALEELVAELGSAFLCAKLSITPQVREDHAEYIANWLQVLKNDKKAIFTASKKAQDATDYLLSL